MSNNREKRIEVKSVHVLLGIKRKYKQGEKACIRTVDKGQGYELESLEAKLRIMGGTWRIHRTVNARDVEKARKWLMKELIDHPEKGAFIDSEWRTALLQRECVYGQKKFMLDIDTKVSVAIEGIENTIRDSDGNILERYESPKGWHYIMLPFDTREVCKLEYVTLLRDGYYFVKEVNNEN